MESARNERGEIVFANGRTLMWAAARSWTCATCPEEVPVHPAKWPCPRCDRDRKDEGCRHPHFYWKTHPDEPHRKPCPRWSEAVPAEIDERIVQSRRGAPGQGPAAIVFDVPGRIRAAGGVGAGDAAAAAVRHARRGVAERDRGDHRATATEIAAACSFFIGHPDDRDRPLRVPHVPKWATRYRTVFKNLRHSDGLGGRTHIWWSKVGTSRMPDHAGPALMLPMEGGRRIIVDRGGWGGAAATFDRTLAAVFEEARRAVREKMPGTWINVLAFAFGRLGEDGAVRIGDARMFHALVELTVSREE